MFLVEIGINQLLEIMLLVASDTTGTCLLVIEFALMAFISSRCTIKMAIPTSILKGKLQYFFFHEIVNDAFV